MAYWTPLDLEQVFNGWDYAEANTIECRYGEVLLEVEPLGNGKARIVRLISSNPMDFMNNSLTPGHVIPIL